MNFPFFMAPMVGLTHVAMRQLVKSYMPEGAKSFWATEMLSSKRLPHQNLGKTPETLREEDEGDLCPQILGNDEHFIRESILKLLNWGVLAIDINMGCPVKKALKHNYGVALMGDKDYASKVVAMATKYSKVPVSVKLRAGQQRDMEFLKSFVDGLVKNGASWICLHPRLAGQKRRGNADWQQIKELKKSFSIPIIGNGDVQTCDDAFRMLDETQCDGVMVGRALTARPWLFWQIGEKLGLPPPKGRKGNAPQTPEEEALEFGHALVQFVDLCEKYFGESLALRKIKFYIRNNNAWLNYGHRLIGISSKAKTIRQLKEELSRFFLNRGLCLSSYTSLRY